MVWTGVVVLTPLAAWPCWARAETDTIVLSGQAAPDGNGTMSTVGPSAPLDNVGRVGFSATLTGTSGGSNDNTGIFRGFEGVITQIARENQLAPDGNGRFDFLYSPTLNAFGDAAFYALLRSTSGGSSDSSGIYRGSGAAITQIAREGQTLPDSNGQYDAFMSWLINDAGQVAFHAAARNCSGGGQTGLFRGTGGSVVQVARQDQAVPDANGTFGSFTYYAMNTGGQVAFHAALTGTSGGATDDTGVFVSSGFILTQVVRENQLVPDANGRFDSLDYPLATNAAGQVAFRSTLRSTSGGTTDNQGLYLASGSTITQIARMGQTAPDGNGQFNSFYYSPVLNDAGQLAFHAYVRTASGTDTGIYRYSDGSLAQIVREGQAAPDANGQFDVLDDPPALAPGGQVAFRARLRNSFAGTGDNEGIYLSDGQEIVQAARRGQSLAGSTITDLQFTGGQDPATGGQLNDLGQIAYWASLADGRQGIFLYTPEVHWRYAGSGSWDTAANWTVSLKPAASHPVLIDPAYGLTVTGPSNHTSVRWLTVGSRIGGIAFLQLGAGGNLTVSETLATLASGEIDLQAGTLTAKTLTNGGSLVQSAGTTLSLNSATNSGTIHIGGAASASGSIENTGSLTVASGATLGTGINLTNHGLLTLADGTLHGPGGLTNHFSGEMAGRGVIDTMFTNDGLLRTTGLLMVTSSAFNVGTLSIPGQTTFRPNGGLENTGVITLSGGSISGTGMVTNLPGGRIEGYGGISAPLTCAGGRIVATSATPLVIANLMSANTNGSELRVNDGGTLNIPAAFTSSGTIVLEGPSATLSGGSIINNGTISGSGQIANMIANNGVIRPEGGQLVLSAWDNSNGGQIQLPAGGTLVLVEGLDSNPGIISLTGGTLDTNATDLDNTNVINGRGILLTGWLVNSNAIALADGVSEIHGQVTNHASITVTNATVTFFGDVTNAAGGSIGVSSGTVRFLGSLVNNGTYNHTAGSSGLGAVSGTGTLTVEAGVSVSATHIRQGTVNLANGASATIMPNGGPAGASKVETLTLAPAARVNLKDNDLVIGTADLRAVRSLITSGAIYTDAAVPGRNTALGYAAGNDPNLAASLKTTGQLSGQTFDGDSVLVKYTYQGDADLDGDTDGNDIGTWALNFTGELGNPASPSKFWTSGDWDYDGDVDGNDAGSWALNFTGELGGGGLSINAPGASPEAVAMLENMGFTVVPEPANLSLLAVGALGLLRWRVRPRPPRDPRRRG